MQASKFAANVVAHHANMENWTNGLPANIADSSICQIYIVGELESFYFLSIC